ncbi:histone H2A deubiquitinase MYSM1-like [Watersipora subatra]|uniref:histone H2A deubiquitinase MYSM1-like n=1 Tax=Watersipora subatra TaxID=2589382 RepID=UPI00355B5373
MERADGDEDVDIESDFIIEKDQFTAERVFNVSCEVTERKKWIKQTIDEDVDSDSKEMILKLLESEAAAEALPPSVMSTHRTAEAMKKTSRRQLWSQEDKALFETGIEIYGKSWKDIAELLPHKSTSQVKSYGLQYFKQKRNALSPKKRNLPAAPQFSTADMTKARVLHGETHPLISKAEVHVLEECESDEEVDIMSDGDDSLCSPTKPGFLRASSPSSGGSFNCKNEPNLQPSAVPALSVNSCSNEFRENFTDVESHAANIAIDAVNEAETGVSIPMTEQNTNEATVTSELTQSSQVSDASLTPKLAVRTEEKCNHERKVDSEGGTENQPEVLYYTPAEHRLDYGVLNSNGELVDMPAPSSETEVDRKSISEQEKQVHFEFFESRANKTPERYLRIRNYILDQWLTRKPKYLNKTSIRAGLKQCGDVNCIGRIHAYLEQLGAINFGCSQAVYQRMAMSGSSTTERSASLEQTPINSHRPRKRKTTAKYIGGTTYEHGSDEEIPAPPVKTSRTSTSKGTTLDSFALMACAEFAKFEMVCPYQVVLESAAAAIMDIHAHLCKTEVIGLLGGRYSCEQDTLTVVRAEPCWSKSTSLHCDMDPVSQTQAGEIIRQAGLQVIGWYHSHPTFVANPSQQDIESQGTFQKWFSQGGDHFLGVILSPYNRASKSVNSEIRCFTTAIPPPNHTLSHSSSRLPFKFDYKVQTSDDHNELVDLVPKVSKLLDMYKNYQHTVDLLDTYSSSSELSSLDKMLQSVESYLQTADEKAVDKNLIIEDLRFVLTSYCERMP